MTKKEMRSRIEALGLRVRVDAEWDGEIRVWREYPGDPKREEREAYYTNDPEDAVGTAEDMAKRHGLA